jgi:hypothetical protein
MEKSMIITKKMRLLFLGGLAVLLLAGLIVIFAQRLAQVREKSEYLQTLQGLSFNKHLNLPASYAGVSQLGNWDGYLYTALEYQCVLGGHYLLLAHHGTEADKTVIWLQPGQECWPDHPNCGNGSRTYTDEQAMEYVASGADGGPFGPTSADPDNPVANWNYIYVPTCDGSFHFGDAAADYDNDGVVDHFHNGLRQTSAAVSLAKELFPKTQKILIAGSSNGGYGTFGAAPIVRLAFPNASLYVLNDSGPGLFSTKEPAVWPILIKTWNLDPMLPADCPECKTQLAYLFDWMLDHDSHLKIGMYSSYQDAVVSSVVGMTGTENEQLLRETTTKFHQKHPDTFKRYFIEGDSHCIADFYNQVNGVSVWSWLDTFVNDRSNWNDILE